MHRLYRKRGEQGMEEENAWKFQSTELTKSSLSEIREIRLLVHEERSEVVRPEGLEPPTPRSVVWCSIH